MTAKDIKRIILSELLYQGYLCGVTEGINSSDVLAVSRNKRFTTEFEIKVSRSDLLGEWKAIKAVFQRKNKQIGLLKDEPMIKCSHTKYYKHKVYLDFEGIAHERQWINFRPNRFCFVVPPELCDLAKLVVENTPYGVKTIELYPNGMKECIRAKHLHKDSIREVDMEKIISRLMVENVAMFNRLGEKPEVPIV